MMSTPIMVPLTRLLSSLWTPSIPLASPSKLPSEGLQDSCTRGFHFLVRLAWESRYMIPVMYAVVSFLFDIQMRLEIIVVRDRVPIQEEEEEDDEGEEGEEGDDDEDEEEEEEEVAEAQVVQNLHNIMPLPYNLHQRLIAEGIEESQVQPMRFDGSENEDGQYGEEEGAIDWHSYLHPNNNQ